MVEPGAIDWSTVQLSWSVETGSGHAGAIPDLILPGGGIDLVFADGSPLPTNWGGDVMLVSVARRRPLTLGNVEAKVFRLPFPAGLLCALDPDVNAEVEGNVRPERKLREIFDRAWRGDRYDSQAAITLVEERVLDLERPFRRKLRCATEAMQVLITESSITNVEQWSRRIGTSTRTLSRTIGDVYMMTPISLLRLHRIRRLVDVISREVSLAEITYCLGFSDQSHLNRETTSFTGLTPGGLRERVSSGSVLFRRTIVADSPGPQVTMRSAR